MYFGHPFEARLQNSIQHSVVTCALHADLGREEVMDDGHRLSAVAVLFIGSFTIERKTHFHEEFVMNL